MYGMPYSIVYNEETGRLEPPHAALMRRIRRTHQLRSRYRSLVIRRLMVRAFRAPWRVVAWDGVTPGPWTREIDGAGAVINLAGPRSRAVLGNSVKVPMRVGTVRIKPSVCTIWAR